MERRVDRLVSEFEQDTMLRSNPVLTYVLWDWHVYRITDRLPGNGDDYWLDFFHAKTYSALRTRTLERLVQIFPANYILGLPVRRHATSSVSDWY